MRSSWRSTRLSSTNEKEYQELIRELFIKVKTAGNLEQVLWNGKKGQRPSRLMHARGTVLLEEEKERNKVIKTLSLEWSRSFYELIQHWEQELVPRLPCPRSQFRRLIAEQKEHIQGLEMEKIWPRKDEEENLLHETRFGAKPSTPAS